MPNLSNLLRRLIEADIEFILVGGFAGVVHGSSYLTDDLDVCAVISPDTIEKLRLALGELHPVHRMTADRKSFMEIPESGVSLNNLYLATDEGVLDVLGSIHGLGSFDEFVDRAEELSLFGLTCRVVSLPDLIRAKESLAREKDLLAAKELRAIAAKRGIPIE